MLGRSAICSFLAALGAALVLSAPGHAAFPGLNGKIVFENKLPVDYLRGTFRQLYTTITRWLEGRYLETAQ